MRLRMAEIRALSSGKYICGDSSTTAENKAYQQI
jgi:hypothetical protein